MPFLFYQGEKVSSGTSSYPPLPPSVYPHTHDLPGGVTEGTSGNSGTSRNSGDMSGSFASSNMTSGSFNSEDDGSSILSSDSEGDAGSTVERQRRATLRASGDVAVTAEKNEADGVNTAVAGMTGAPGRE